MSMSLRIMVVTVYENYDAYLTASILGRVAVQRTYKGCCNLIEGYTDGSNL